MNYKLIHIIFLIQILKVELNANINDSDISKDNQKEDWQEELIELNDSNFDSVIQNGYKNRWLILFYLETCYHCYRARTLINRILELRDYNKINNIKFASIEIKNNSKCNIRFNMSGVPYIILVENNTMYELDSYASEKNLINFIGTDFMNVTSELKPFPQYSVIKHYYRLTQNSLFYVIDIVNNYLESKNIKFKFNGITFVLSYMIICIIVWTSVILIFEKCFSLKNTKKKIKKKLD